MTMAAACLFTVSPPMIKRKIKTVSFRLSVEDYANFQQACEAYGFATVSEFARRSMQQFIDERSTAARDILVQGLQDQVHFLTGEVTRLARAIGVSELPVR
jgi:hypothetical protein